MSENKKNGKDISVEFLEEEEKETPQSKEHEGKQSEEKVQDKQAETKQQILEEYEKKIEEYQNRYKELNEQHLRLRAEFANYKRRMAKEQTDYAHSVKSEIAKKLLPIIDDFNHMFEKSENETNEKTVFEGVKLIYDKFNQVLNELGVEKIEALGQEFDPLLHEAMMMQKTTDKEKHNKVVSVFQEGYVMKDKLLRPSKVVVGSYEEQEESE